MRAFIHNLIGGSSMFGYGKQLAGYFLIAFAAMCALMLVGPPVAADGCRARVSYSYPTYSSYSYSTPYYAPSYTPSYDYKEVIKVREVVIPTYAIVPLYGAYYTPPAMPLAAPAVAQAPTTPMPAAAPTIPTMPMPGKAPCSDVDAKVKALEIRFDQLITALNATALAKPGGTNPVPASAPTTPTPAKAPTNKKEELKAAAIGVYKLRCAACHNPTVGDAKKGSFDMFDAAGGMTNLTDKQWLKVAAKTAKGAMPPEKDSDGKPVAKMTEQEYAITVEYMNLRNEDEGK